jgi:hypothetical protein
MTLGSVGSREFKPFTAIKILDYRRLLNKCIINSLMINRRWFHTAICVIMPDDEIAPDRRDLTRVADCFATLALKSVDIRFASNLDDASWLRRP